MKTTLIAATLALAFAAPFGAMADDDAPATEAAATFDAAPAAPPAAAAHVYGSAGSAGFIGPAELHNGLLPNGLLPAPAEHG
ncbi:MAG: hypothetical protein J0I21_20525 [Alphaproteobacteria bacterium]|nr:hypothetical protein [Alphaproteobacteria bacterium]